MFRNWKENYGILCNALILYMNLFKELGAAVKTEYRLWRMKWMSLSMDDHQMLLLMHEILKKSFFNNSADFANNDDITHFYRTS